MRWKNELLDDYYDGKYDWLCVGLVVLLFLGWVTLLLSG